MLKLIQALSFSLIMGISIVQAGQEDQDDIDFRAGQVLQKKAESIHIAHIELISATISQCLDVLQKKAKELDPEHKGISLILDGPPKDPHSINASLDDISVSELIKIAGDDNGLHEVFKADGIHLTDAPEPPLVDLSPTLHELIDKLKNNTYYKCAIICTPNMDMTSTFRMSKIQVDELKAGDTIEYVLRGLEYGGKDRLLALLHGFKIMGRGKGEEVNIYWAIIFYNKNGTTDEIDLNEGLDEGTWNGRKLVGDREVRMAVKGIIANLQPPPIDD